MPYPHRLLSTVAALASLMHACGCSSKFRNNNEGESSAGGMSSTASGGTNSGGATGTTGGVSNVSGGNGGASAATDAGGGSANVGGGSANVGGSSATDAGGSSATDAGGSSATDAGGSSASVGGSAGTDAGGSAGTDAGGSAGTGGSPVVMACDPEEPDCACDAAGCFLVDGASCTLATDCRTQVCGVTQDAVSVCCAEACSDDQVCSADGSECEVADVCEEALERCSADGDHQRCTGGQWGTVTECDGLGCSIELTGGCLSPLGTGCGDSDECGQGTCQETSDGDSACCDASCGSCQVCNAEGTGCVEPAAVMPGCDCTTADASNCDDDIPCTVDSCQDGSCANEVESGYCLIDGACYDHNQPEPGNACRYCDAALRDRAWTNSANTVSCNDNAWCNGGDTCNGTGQCLHEYPTSNRCTESGPCALTTCDEARDSCYQPDTFECATESEDRCKPVGSGAGKCPGEIQRATTVTYCSGTSAVCDGASMTGNFVKFEDCGGTCDAETVTCVPTLPCSAACDGSTDLCWTTPATEPAPMSVTEADAYCEGLVFGSSDDWRLPTIDEWLQVAKGCDEATGEAQAVSFQSTCTFDPDEDDPLKICEDFCPVDAGPTEGCYWRTPMGACDPVGYWSSTVFGDPLVFSATYNNVHGLVGTAREAVRCVTENP